MNRRRFPQDHAGAPEIIGHRGASHDAPENTLPSIRLAWDQGADAVEIDVYLTRDRRIVAMHDTTTQRYTGRDAKPSDLTLAELKQLDFGKWKDAKWAGTRIATLPEILATIPAGKRLVIEIKCGPDIAPELVEDIRRSGKSADQICFIAFSTDVMQALKARLPAHEAYWLIAFNKDPATGHWRPSTAEVFAGAARLGADGLDVSVSGPYDGEFARRMAENRFLFCVWTVNDVETARRFIALGAHSITTDRPGWLREQLAKEP
jgi:glycerophosphoryl diester phosphodiesterase